MKYQCGDPKTSKNGLRTNIVDTPEDVELDCKGVKSWIVKVGTKCTVKCKTGSPDYEQIQCKQAGWRPTNELKCEGINPGVVVAVLIGGLAAVVIIAILYAKYKQKNKSKNQRNPHSKGNANPGARRPGQTIEPGSTHHRPMSSSSGYVGSTAESDFHSRGSWKSENGNHKQPSAPPYNKIEKTSDAGRLSSHSSGGGRVTSSMHSEDRRRRQLASEVQPLPQYGERYPYEESSALPLQQIGYNNGAYFGDSQYGYPANEPTSVGYGSFAQPPAYPPNRDFHRPYHVPT